MKMKKTNELTYRGRSESCRSSQTVRTLLEWTYSGDAVNVFLPEWQVVKRTQEFDVFFETPFFCAFCRQSEYSGYAVCVCVSMALIEQ